MEKMPRDGANHAMPITPGVVALEETYDTTISSSTELTLNSATTLVRVYAIDQDVLLKWGTSDVSTSDFDEVIPAGQIVDLAVPRQSDGTLYTALNVIERVATANVIIIEK